MVPIKEAIESGAWLKAEFPMPFCNNMGDFKSGHPMQFQVRIREFLKADLSQATRIKTGLGANPNIWFLKMEIINLCKIKLSASTFHERLRLVESGFEFECTDGCYFSWNSTFLSRHNLDYDQYLPPKIKRANTIIFELPEDANEMSIMLEKGISLAEA